MRQQKGKNIPHNKFFRDLIREPTSGQSYKTFYILGKTYKLVLKLDNVLWLRKYLVRTLGHYTLKFLQSNFFDRGPIGNLGTLFYTS